MNKFKKIEIYGLDEEIIIDGLRDSGNYDNALVIIGVSRFRFYSNNYRFAYDAWEFYDTMNDLAFDGYIPYYTSFVAIDDKSEDGSHSRTHVAIYTTTVDWALDNADWHTGGNDQTIVFISSHGSKDLRCFFLYDTWWWGRWYSDNHLAGEVQKQTIEGTDMWLWLVFCHSDSFYATRQYQSHFNHVVYWTYDHDTWADKRDVEIEAFIDIVEMSYSLMENIFNYVDYVYHVTHAHQGDYHMTQRDYNGDYTYFCLYGI